MTFTRAPLYLEGQINKWNSELKGIERDIKYKQQELEMLNSQKDGLHEMICELSEVLAGITETKKERNL